MKLQKLLKKLALPVFALVVVSMLAACSSPSGGDSGSGNGNGNGGKTDNPPALEDTTEYGINLGSLTTEQQKALKDAIEAAGGSVGETMTGADIEAAKEALSEAGYTYTEKDGTVTIEKKPAPSSGSEGQGEYTVKYEDLVLFTVNEEILKEMPTNAGTKNGNVITMSSAWITEGLSSESEKHGKEYVALIFYGNDKPGYISKTELTSIESLLEKNTDYKISSDKKVIVITESGLVKYFGASTEFVDTDIQVTPLFDVSELTVAAERIAWTEGTWLLKIITDYSDGTKAVDEDKIKADSSGIKYTEMIFTQTGTVTESMSKAQIDMLTAAGKINGNQYTYTVKTSEDDIAKENEHIVSSFNRSISYLKTNADKTKYYWKTTGTSSREGVKLNTTKKYYLEKKSGSSTPVTLPESGSSSHSDGPTSPATPTPDTNISFIGKFEGTVSGNALGSYVTYNIYIESTNKADYDVTLYETGLEFSPYFKDKGTIVSKDETSTVTVYQGKGTGHSLFITTYEEGEMEVTISLTSGLNYKGPITTPKSSEANKPNTEGTLTTDGSSGENSATGGSPQQNEEMIDMLEADSYEGIKDNYYSFWEGEDNFCFYIGEADLEKFIAYFTFSESNYDIDESEKKLVLTASGIKKFEEQTKTVYAGEGEKSTAHSSSKDYDEKN